jgi:hypothetical protein
MKFVDLITNANQAANGSMGSLGALLRQFAARTMGAATGSSAAATLSALQGKITSESLATAQNAFYTLTLTNDQIAAGDIVLASVANGTNTQGTPMIGRVQPAAGSCVIEVINKHASAVAFNGTVVISFSVIKAA